MAVRERQNILGRSPQTIHKSLKDIYDRRDRYDMRPTYQRDIKWALQTMCDLVSTVMDNGFIPSLVFYKLRQEDKQGRTVTHEVVDGQHRLYTMIKFMHCKWITLGKKRVMISWIYKNGGKPEHIFPRETTDTREWFALNAQEPKYFTEEELQHLEDFILDIRELDCPLTMDMRRGIFMKLQQGVAVKNSDLVKNNVECPLIRWMSEYEYEDKMKNVVLAFSIKKAPQYYVAWVCRFFCIFGSVMKFKAGKIDFETMLEETSREFIKGDSDYMNDCKRNNETIFSDISIANFHDAFESFLVFLQRTCKENKEGVEQNLEFNPTQLFALFQYGTAVSFRDLTAFQMNVVARDGKKTPYKSMWEKDLNETRKVYYKECIVALYCDIQSVPSAMCNKKITTKLKRDAWINRFGDVVEARCDCGTIITKENHHCGHIVSRARGGVTELENLMPVCAACNLRMGTETITEYFKSMCYDV